MIVKLKDAIEIEFVAGIFLLMEENCIIIIVALILFSYKYSHGKLQWNLYLHYRYNQMPSLANKWIICNFICLFSKFFM